jgi:hypothetical protein
MKFAGVPKDKVPELVRDLLAFEWKTGVDHAQVGSISIEVDPQDLTLYNVEADGVAEVG